MFFCMSNILLFIATAHVLGKREELPGYWSEISMNVVILRQIILTLILLVYFILN